MPPVCVRRLSHSALVLVAALAMGGAALAQQPAAVPAHPAPAAASPAPPAPAAARPAPAPAPAVSAPSFSPAPTATTPPPAVQPAAVPAPVPAAAAPSAPANPSDPANAAAPASAAPALPEALPPAANGVLPHDLSPWGMFMAADLVVKAVMLGLAFASVVTWTVWLVKTFELIAANRAVRRTLKILRLAPSLLASAKAVPGKEGGAAGAVVRAALAEVEVSRALPAEGIKERVAVALNRIEAHAARRMVLGTGLLATIGSTAPFVGLFGTVWGIMNSFIGISKANTTNLAVVAPGIAEALLATAIGLVAAIPAVIIYNVFARAIANYKASLADASAEVMRHLSRDLDREATAPSGRLRAAAE
ncbi:tonB-system energizer ExbB [Aquabacter sp. CN5-332]|uniref:tonB-system energizer ExbB n=1 Tax=Aquabacter sp. CN5-332 TaxID=3156608 RepID=UPI0032B3C838